MMFGLHRVLIRGTTFPFFHFSLSSFFVFSWRAMLNEAFDTRPRSHAPNPHPPATRRVHCLLHSTLKMALESPIYYSFYTCHSPPHPTPLPPTPEKTTPLRVTPLLRGVPTAPRARTLRSSSGSSDPTTSSSDPTTSSRVNHCGGCCRLVRTNSSCRNRYAPRVPCLSSPSVPVADHRRWAGTI